MRLLYSIVAHLPEKHAKVRSKTPRQRIVPILKLGLWFSRSHLPGTALRFGLVLIEAVFGSIAIVEFRFEVVHEGAIPARLGLVVLKATILNRALITVVEAAAPISGGDTSGLALGFVATRICVEVHFT
jgi:hypothetical protein